MQTAPFVKPRDRAQKDVSDMSMSDFAPKRFALKYEPIPMIGKFEQTDNLLTDFNFRAQSLIDEHMGDLMHLLLASND